MEKSREMFKDNAKLVILVLILFILIVISVYQFNNVKKIDLGYINTENKNTINSTAASSSDSANNQVNNVDILETNINLQPLNFNKYKSRFAEIITPVDQNTYKIVEGTSTPDNDFGRSDTLELLGQVHTGEHLYRYTISHYGYKGSGYGYTYYLLRKDNTFKYLKDALSASSTLSVEKIGIISEGLKLVNVNYKISSKQVNLRNYSDLVNILLPNNSSSFVVVGESIRPIDTSSTSTMFYVASNTGEIVVRHIDCYMSKCYDSYNYAYLLPGINGDLSFVSYNYKFPSTNAKVKFPNGKNIDINKEYNLGPDYNLNSIFNPQYLTNEQKVGMIELGTVDPSNLNLKVYYINSTNNSALNDNYSHFKKYYDPIYLSTDTPVIDKEKISFEDYKNMYPLLVVEDKNGFYDFLYSVKLDSYSAAEPIIYLYPEKDSTEIKVKLEKNHPYASWPTYDDGWNVIANKDGRLMSKVNNKSWTGDRIFYESDSHIYDVPNVGDIVEKKNIANYLKHTLKEYSLNDKETNDFIDAWLPIFESRKTEYFLIGFYNTEEVSKILPLNVKPKPDTIIRIGMYFKDVDNIHYVHEPRVKPNKILERKGFTLVEWGGLIK